MQKFTILIVDDDEAVRESLRYLLERNGFAVTTAGDGQDALTKISQKKPDLITLDVVMPRMDGLEVCVRLRNDPETRDIPVIFLSSQPPPPGNISALPGASITYIDKLCDCTYLIEEVCRSFSKKRESPPKENR